MHAEQLLNYNPATSSAGPFPGTFAGGANLRAAEEVDNPAWSKNGSQNKSQNWLSELSYYIVHSVLCKYTDKLVIAK
jgi:hypothetical protein